MSNYIKINVTDPGSDLPLKLTTYNSGSTPPITDPQFTLGTGWNGGGGTSTAVAVTGGSGSGAEAEITTSAGNVVTDITITVAGTDYEVGDTITISIPDADPINGSGGIIDTTIELTAAMLVAITPGTSLMNADNIVGVGIGDASGNTVTVYTNRYSGSNVYAYTLTFDLDSTTIEQLCVNVSEAFRQASQAPLSLPTVELGDAECIAYDFG